MRSSREMTMHLACQCAIQDLIRCHPDRSRERCAKACQHYGLPIVTIKGSLKQAQKGYYFEPHTNCTLVWREHVSDRSTQTTGGRHTRGHDSRPSLLYIDIVRYCSIVMSPPPSSGKPLPFHKTFFASAVAACTAEVKNNPDLC